MRSTVDRLMGVDALGSDVFGSTIEGRGSPRLFGGQVAGQALLAACRTVEAGRPPHSLHAYFILGGRPGIPLQYRVDRTRDGRSFTTRQVSVRQDGRTIFEMLASFQRPEKGPDWQMRAPPIGTGSPRYVRPCVPVGASALTGQGPTHGQSAPAGTQVVSRPSPFLRH